MQIGFIGLGNMGEPIAGNLSKHNALTVYNRSPQKAESLKNAGARVASSVNDACSGAEIIFTMLSNDQALEPIALEILESMPADCIHVSSSTISTALAARLAKQYKDKDRTFVSAPVFGRPPAALSAQLVLVAAGEPSSIEKCLPIFQQISRKVIVVGKEPEQANLIKLSGNFMIASIIEAMAESCAIIRKSGMHQKDFLEIICDDLFPSPIIKAYGDLMREDKFTPAGFALELGAKDIRLVLAAAEQAQVPMPLASLLHNNFLSGIARGKAKKDWSALAEIARENAGL